MGLSCSISMRARFIIKGKIVIVGKGDIRSQSSELLKLLVIEDSTSALSYSQSVGILITPDVPILEDL